MNEFDFYKKINRLKILLKDNIINKILNIDVIIENLYKLKEEENKIKEELKLNPNDYNLHIIYGEILIDLERFEEAEKEIKKALEINPSSFEAHYVLGKLFNRLNRISDAQKEYKLSIELNPNYSYAHYSLGNLLFDLNRFDEAYEEYKLFLKCEPKEYMLLAYKFILCSNDDNFKENLLFLRKLLIEMNITEKIDEIDELIKKY